MNNPRSPSKRQRPRPPLGGNGRRRLIDKHIIGRRPIDMHTVGRLSGKHIVALEESPLVDVIGGGAADEIEIEIVDRVALGKGFGGGVFGLVGGGGGWLGSCGFLFFGRWMRRGRVWFGEKGIFEGGG